ncbi:S-formylglutathione hydrolase [Amylibacter kogurei]|uniref:S-formylglutathione hydrolase n=1 Tax=Paramylibacter kogurei TaxID=1889778 RepID=A0A2G5K5U3_9RHOB|nr:S-formylglutathione hydrolase [Amylibacter kogurei]PIB24074.1 S-formylglutathione hydrolase [Amylibacter kogurei]
MEIISENKCFGGVQGVYKHASSATQCDMTFAVFMPPQAAQNPVPVLWYLSGLTCTHENAMIKAFAQGFAAEHGLALVFPDTSPRGDDIANHDDYDLGQGAGFYVNATQKPWAPHFQMWDYVTDELPTLVATEFNVRADANGITGHSMGGHGALTIAMTLPDRYQSLSAFAPIANPTASDWGRKQFSAYLGDDETTWVAHDASILMREHGFHSPILIDQGLGDNFLDLLKPQSLNDAMAARGQAGEYRMQDGYDHSYYFVQSFMQDHIKHHAALLT